MIARDTLLLACSTTARRAALRALFEDDFNLLEANNIRQTKLFLEQNHSCIAAMILDITASGISGQSILNSMEKADLLKEIPVVIITDTEQPDVRISFFEKGAIDVYHPDTDLYILQHRVHNIVELHRHRWHLEELLEEQTEILRHSNDAIVDTLSSIIEYRSVESGQHILRIRHFTQQLLEEVARSCPEYNLSTESIRIISSAVALHDIGKISIPDSILNKPGPLTEEEWAIMRSHPLTGCRILESLRDFVNPDYLRYAHNICHYHHERWDGGGYPEKIAGDDIPICAQAAGLADAYDALTNKRVYKDAYSFDRSVNMILNGECGVFSPKLLECFKQVNVQFEEIARAYADGLSPKSEVFDVTLPPPVQQEGRTTLHTVQGKYQAMLHYANAAIMEVDLDQELYHLVYNPDPNLFFPQSGFPFHEDDETTLQRTICPEDQERFRQVFRSGIQRFFQDGLHRQTHSFGIRSRGSGEPELYHVTLLRLEPNDPTRRRMMVIWRRADPMAELVSPDTGIPAQTGTLLETCRCRNDALLTLDGGTDISFLVGYSPEELETRFRSSLMELALPQDRPMIRKKFDEQLAHGKDVELTYQVHHKGGHPVWILHKGRLVLDSDGHEYLYSILIDVTRVKSAQATYNLTLEQYQAILAQTGHIIFDWDLNADVISFSRTWQSIFGYTPIHENAYQQLSTASHFHPDDIQRFFDWAAGLREGDSSQPLEIRVANSQGRYLWCRFRATASFDEAGKATHLLGIIVNIDAEKQAARALQQQADQDSLTKLLHKQAARRQAEEYLNSFSHGASCAMLIIDLDNFKQVNDQYGHMFGDAILSQAARELKKLFRSHDIVARIGGDEFMILMRDIFNRELVEQRCSQLLSVFDQVFRSQLYDCPVGCSIGVALGPIHGRSYHDLFQHADQALYQAKAAGKNRHVIYDSKDPVYHTPRQLATTRIDSEEQPGLANNSIVQYAFQRLYSSKDMESAVNEILAIVGQQINASRVYVFENTPDNKYCNNTFEWCSEGVLPEIHNLQNISYETDIPNYEDNFDEHGIFYCPDINELPQHIYDIVAPQGIKSMLHCAIRDNGVFRGYIGFDECFTKRLWTKEQVQTLTYFAEMLSVFLLKERASRDNARRAEDFVSILDNQKSWIYVIDPDTCQLRFLNARTRSIAPNAREGMLCHEALMGLPERCPNCPARDIRTTKNCECSIVNELFHLHVLSEATLIRWGGEDACLISCREIQEAK